MKMLVLTGIVLVFVSVKCDPLENQVPIVAENLESQVSDNVDQLIGNHWYQELMYLYYSKYFTRGDVSLHGIGKFFQRRSLAVEEKKNNLITLLNKRGGFVSFRVLDLNGNCANYEASTVKYNLTLDLDSVPFNCSAYDGQSTKPKDAMCNMDTLDMINWRPALYAFRDMMTAETYVYDNTQIIVNRMDTDPKYYDPSMRHHIELQLDDMVEIKRQVGGYISRLLAYESRDDYFLGEYLLSEDLQPEDQSSQDNGNDS